MKPPHRNAANEQTMNVALATINPGRLDLTTNKLKANLSRAR